MRTRHTHVTRDIKPPGQCPGCDDYHLSRKGITMANLPPGVTHAEIDRHFGGERNDWPGTLECDHADAADSIGAALGADTSLSTEDAERLAEKVGALFEQAQSTFEDHEVAELSSWAAGGYDVTARWRCPVCGTEHETTEEFGPDPDADRD